MLHQRHPVAVREGFPHREQPVEERIAGRELRRVPFGFGWACVAFYVAFTREPRVSRVFRGGIESLIAHPLERETRRNAGFFVFSDE